MPGLGAGGYIGYAKEASGNTPVVPTNYIEAFSESFSHNLDRFEVKNIVGGRYAEPDDMTGVSRVQGQVVAPFHPIDGGMFLLGAMGVNSIVIQGTSLWQHNFAMRNSDWDNLFATQPFTFEIYRDVTSAQQYSGVCMSGLELSVTPNQDLRMTVDMIGKSATNKASTTPTYTTSPAFPFAFDTCSISVDGAAFGLMESFTMRLDNSLEGIATLINSSFIRAIRRNNFQMIRLSGNMQFEDITEYGKYLAQTEVNFTASFTRASSFQMIIKIPRLVYSAYPLAIGGRERIVVGWEGMARYHQGSGAAMTIQLTNTRSFY